MSSWALPPRVIRSSPAVEPAECMCGSLQLLFPPLPLSHTIERGVTVFLAYSGSFPFASSHAGHADALRGA